MPADLLRLPVLRAALLAFLSNHAQFSVWLLMPFFLVGPLGLTPTVGGLVFALTPLANALVAPLGGWATDRVGPRGPLACGLALEVAGLLTIGTLSGAPRSSWSASRWRSWAWASGSSRCRTWP